MTGHDISWLLGTTDLQALRKRCGITQATIAAALGVSKTQVVVWEGRHRHPAGTAGSRYARLIAALRNHDDITRQLDAEDTTERNVN